MSATPAGAPVSPAHHVVPPVAAAAIDGVDLSGPTNPRPPADVPFVAVRRSFEGGPMQLQIWERSKAPQAVLDALAAAHTMFSRLATPVAQPA